MTRSRCLLLVVVAVPCMLSLPACGSESNTTQTSAPPTADAGGDTTGQDASPDVANDAPQQDALEETVSDATVDAAQDAPEDAAADQTGDVEEPWPTCDAQPNGVPAKSIPDIWQENPSTPTAVWVPGAIITAISKGGCAAGSACQIFLQTDETYATLADGAHHAIKLFVSGNTSGHFTSLHTGDRVDVYAHAWRYNVNPPQNELLLQVNLQLRGCAKAVGTATPTPVAGVELTDLTVDAYENTVGPLLVQVQGVSGKPGSPTETFGLWKTGGPFVDAGPEGIVSASPYFLPAGWFTGLPTDGQTVVQFDSITGVFGLFIPGADGGGSKYLELYPRQMTDMPHP